MEIIAIIVIVAIIIYMFTRTDWHPDKLKPKMSGDNKTVRSRISHNAGTATLPTSSKNYVPDKRAEFIIQQIGLLNGITNGAREALIHKCVDSNVLEKHDLAFVSSMYKRYFSNTTWTWSEYEFWLDYGERTGVYPSAFGLNLRARPDISIENIFDYITLPVAKTVLNECGIEPPSKDVRKGIIKIAQNNKHISDLLIKTVLNRQQYDVFSLFIQTLSLRVREFNKLMQFCKIDGDMDMELRYLTDPKNVVEIGKAKGFSKVPPFVPGGLDCWVPKI